ncbi:PilT/PilU family type 4a pilus ATPase [Rhabdochromatium marinum]|uniref:PilT/PilU family type 4a pilus ATPase n=1 Tax=Rhabdochromatium marinum TaxID=48729 RepID=UPI001904D48A|nr:PilT/PilU family type 4a pilus ATPase [Rhabdochromatium marinum]MBK1647542.1 type IV pili twitching motility protein PilT [Rhabdochromatium marinum]
MDRQQAAKFMLDCLRMMMARKGSDLFISADFPPACKIDGKLTPLSEKPLSVDQTGVLVRSIMNDYQLKEYDANKECNFAISPPGIGRFRVNAFVQQGRAGVVLRTIPTEIPEIDELGLPPVLKDLVLTKNGMILVVGGTGSGKSTSLAAMIGYRNEKTHGHIITIEDPVEFVHRHRNCLITQREVGVDTDSWDNALVNTLRQAPNVILIGEIRQRETMEHAINFAETGHLCLSTLHANNANQALDRIINMFPEERRPQLLMDLSLNLKAVISQRLLPRVGGGRVAAIEILINSPLIQDLIFKGKVHEIKGVMKRSREQGMQTFDMALFDLYEAGLITLEDGLRSADSMNELRLKIKLESAEATEGDAFGDTNGLSLVGEDDEEEGAGQVGGKPAADNASETVFDLDSFDLAEASLDLETDIKK